MKRILALLLALAMVLSLAACGSGSSDTEETATETASTVEADPSVPSTTVGESGEPVYGGSATFYINEMYNYFDPAMDENRNYSLWLENLWGMDWSMNDAETYAYNTNYVTYEYYTGQIATDDPIDLDAFLENGYLTVTIRDDIYFQEKDAEYDVFGGRNLTASDVKYSYDRLLGTGSGWDEPFECDTVWTDQLYMIESIEVVDDYTLIFYFNEENVTESALNVFITRPVNITGPEWDTLTTEQQNDWHYAVGTGAYILTGYEAGSYYQFTKNENYYDYDERYPENKLPYIDEITLAYIGDSATVLTQFTSGNLDWFNNANAMLSDSELAQLRSTAAGYGEVALEPSFAQSIALKCNIEPFDDINVRIAVQKAINLEEIYYSYFGNTGDFTIPSMWSGDIVDWASYDDWDEELLAEYSYDPEGAIAILEEVFGGVGDDGYYFSFEVAVDPMSDMDLYILAQSYLAAVNVNMTLSASADMGEAMDIAANSEDSRMTSGTIGQYSDIAMAYVFAASTGARYSIFDPNEEFDALFTELQAAVTIDEQNVLAKELDILYAQNHWQIVLGTAGSSNFYSSRIKGYTAEDMYQHEYMSTMTARLWIEE